jgi:hypothetical protein
MGNDEVRHILSTYPHEITSWVCANSNVDRTADEKGAQSWLFEKKVKEHTHEHMRWFVDEFIGDLWKIPRPELRLEALLATPTNPTDQG